MKKSTESIGEFNDMIYEHILLNFKNLGKIGQVLEKHNSPEPDTKKKKENLIGPIFVKEIDSIL